MYEHERLNGVSSAFYDGDYSTSKQCSHATLRNVGNTCFLNSVLYTLRYTPGFLPNLHHLHMDLLRVHKILEQNKFKSSSLGRNIPSLVGSSSRSNSSKDLSLTCLRQDDMCGYLEKSDSQSILEELHALYVRMHDSESPDGRSSPLAPRRFKAAFVKKYESFSGNMQQDAHEFFINLLNAMRDCCQYLEKKTKDLNERENSIHSRLEPTVKEESLSKRSIKERVLRPFTKSRKNSTKNSKPAEQAGATSCDDTSDEAPSSVTKRIKSPSETLVHDEFEAISVLRTKCLVCECVTERKEILSNLNIPAEELRDGTYEFKDVCVSTELLIGINKYYCENCYRYCEAKREVRYEKLPRILVFQFNASKANSYPETPLQFVCFCEECDRTENFTDKHKYQLFSAIMHKGAAIAEGHYVSYVKDLTRSPDYFTCENDTLDALSSYGCKDKIFCANSGSKRGPRGLFKKVSGSNSSNLPTNGELATINGKVNGASAVICERNVSCCCIKANDAYLVKDCWMECNDEALKYLSPSDFNEQLLKSRRVNFTPYLLFYVRIKK